MCTYHILLYLVFNQSMLTTKAIIFTNRNSTDSRNKLPLTDNMKKTFLLLFFFTQATIAKCVNTLVLTLAARIKVLFIDGDRVQSKLKTARLAQGDPVNTLRVCFTRPNGGVSMETEKKRAARAAAGSGFQATWTPAQALSAPDDDHDDDHDDDDDDDARLVLNGPLCRPIGANFSPILVADSRGRPR